MLFKAHATKPQPSKCPLTWKEFGFRVIRFVTEKTYTSAANETTTQKLLLGGHSMKTVGILSFVFWHLEMNSVSLEYISLQRK